MKIVFTPDWFLLGDVLIDLISFATLLLFFIFSVKSYKMSKNKKSLYLGIGFLLIALAELAVIFTKFILYYDTGVTQTIGQMIVTHNVVQSVDIFYYLGFFFHKFFTLIGLYIIYMIPVEKKSKGEMIIAFYLILLSSILSSGIYYYIFYITALIFLVFIVYRYYRLYETNRSTNSCMLVLALAILGAGFAVMIMSKMSYVYVFGQILQLVSYIILLVLIIRITKHGKEKKPQ